ncbi:hypothetical protein K2X89_10620, partial [Myxococcota bacterium]|nr:hypothetical protein [Myxococcota bacterium]
WLVPNLLRIAGLLRNENPERALAWLLPKAPSAERTRGLTETAGTWAKQDFDVAWRWFERNATSARDPQATLTPTDSAILAGLVRRMARIRPADAAPWALRLRPESDRIEMIRRVAYFWSATDPTAADAWIERLQLDPDAMTRVREAAIWGRSEDDTPEPTGPGPRAQTERPGGPSASADE